MFCYEYIFKQFFINILLDFKPNKNEFYNFCIKRIDQYKIFNFVPNPYDMMEFDYVKLENIEESDKGYITLVIKQKNRLQNKDKKV